MGIETAAAKFASIGLHVFPYVASAKVPFKGSRGHIDATDDPEKVVYLFQKYTATGQAAGIGCHTGASGVLVPDIDNKDAGLAFKQRAGADALKTLITDTKNGWHFWYRVPDGLVMPNGAAGMFGVTGFDYKAGSSWVALPPSPFKDGSGAYQFRGRDLEDVLANFWDLVIPAPDSVLELIMPGGEKKKSIIPELISDDGRLIIPRGKRHQGFFAIGGKLRHLGMSEGSILGSLKAINEHDTDVPFTGDELKDLERTAKDICSHEPGVLPFAVPRSIEWQTPVDVERPTLPAFPIDALPQWLADWVTAAAEASQVPPDMPGMLVLAALAACAHRWCDVQIRDGWIEPLGLYVIVTLGSGERKSSTISSVFRPIYEAESLLQDSLRATRLRQLAEVELQREVVKVAKGAAKDGKEKNGVEIYYKAEEKLTALNDAVEPLPRLTLGNATPEAFNQCLADHGAITIVSAEGGVLQPFAGQYSKTQTPNLDPLTNAHAGDVIQIDRKGAEPLTIKRGRASMALAVQPSIVRGLRNISGAYEQGLVARLLTVFPEPRIGSRAGRSPAVPKLVDDEYMRRMQGLAIDLTTLTEPHLIKFSDEADRALEQLHNRIEPQCATTGTIGKAGAGSWGSKLCGATARLATLLHLAEHGKGGIVQLVTEETANQAIRIAETYLLPHALVMHDAIREADDRVAARSIIAWIRENETTQFSSRDVTREVHAVRESTELRDRALVDLESLGFLQRAPEETTKVKGGRPSTRWLANPAIHENTGQNGQKAAESEPAGVLSVLSGESEVSGSGEVAA